MRRARQTVDGAMLPVYERIITLYAPYVLVRCAAYPNGRRQAQQIAVYVLVCTCLLSGKVRHLRRVGKIVDVMMRVVGPDVVLSGEGRDWWGDSGELLLVDTRMRNLVKALNVLKRPWREVLVLHHITGMETSDLAGLWHRSADQIAMRVHRAERLSARCLGGLLANGDRPSVPGVRSLLAQFAAALDAGWIEEVTLCAMNYLIGRAGLMI